MAKKKSAKPKPARTPQQRETTRKKQQVSKHWGRVFGGMSKTAKDNVTSSRHPSAKVFKNAAKRAAAKSKKKK